MGRSSKSGRKHDHDDEEEVDKRHRRNPVQDENHSKHGDSTRHHHHRYDDEEPEASRNKSDRHEGRTKHDKKHRRDRSKRKQYSSGDDDSDMVTLKKERHRKHDRHRIDDNADSEKRKKRRHRNDDDDDVVKTKKTKKENFLKETAALDTERKITVDKSKLHALGEPLGHPPDVILDPERDYFAQNQRFRIYLYRECGLTFDELSSQDARNKFKDFVRQFNRGDLEAGYYAAQVPMEALEECPSTRHQWGLKITHQDSQNLQILQEGVRKQTEYQVTEFHGSAATGMNKQGTSQGNVVLSANTSKSDQNTGETLIDGLHHDRNNRVINRRMREHVQTTMEELTGGKKEGRERQIEKRQERAAKIHGASKYQQDIVELDDAALYGGNTNDDFHRMATASRKRAAAQEAKKEERLLELQRKEEEKQNAMLQMLGLSHRIGQSKIVIQPRNDPPDDVVE